MTTREVIERYFRAVESHDVGRVGACLHDDVEIVEHPNKISPAGRRYDKAGALAGAEKGKSLLADEHYEIRSMIVEDDRAAVLTIWSATIATTKQTMRAQICSVIHVKDDKIWRQEQYDCFE